MSIRLAKKVGFCFGVKRAIDMAERVLAEEGKACSLGSIIHNAQVVDDLSQKGLKVIKDIDESDGGCIVVSSHGISPKAADEISKRSFKLVDTTCPFVRSAQRIARVLSEEGFNVIIVGDVNHPEVKALVDFAGNKAHVVRDVSEFKALGLNRKQKVGALSQTTQSMDNFLSVVRAIIDSNPARFRLFNTICRDADQRQAAAQEVAREVDLMLIVGGRTSANTKRLLQVCKKILAKSYLVESEKGLKDEWFGKALKVGITSGASTPEWLVQKVVKKVKSKMKFIRQRGRKGGCKR